MSILIVGEFPTLNEAQAPFSNGLWRFFKAKLSEAGISPRGCEWTNVLSRPASSMFAFTQREKKGSTTLLPAVAKAAYLRPEFDSHILALYETINRLSPNLILACGDLPLLALCHDTKLKFARGRVTWGIPAIAGRKVLPVWHPRAVQADITQEPILSADLRKARREASFPEVRRPQRFLHLRPSLEDLESFWQTYLLPASHFSIDVETIGGTITCFGIAPSADRALCIPFFDEEKPDGNYWPSFREEFLAWQFVRRCLTHPTARILGQNFSYDVQYFLRTMGLRIPRWTDDTMVLHHALQPEMEKGLGFLASIYTDEPPWKGMHKQPSSDRTAKKEDM